MSVIWHDLECGAYAADLALWRSLAAEHGDPVLEIGAGTGRITLDLARRGHRVHALDCDQVLISELACRGDRLPVSTTVADAREFDLGLRFALILVPMQTVQLLGGSLGRGRFLERCSDHLEPGGVVAIAISETLELYQLDGVSPMPLPDIRELDGVVYSSQPTAVRAELDEYVLERRRQTVTVDGRLTVEQDVIRLDRLSATQLERESVAAGLRPAGRATVPATVDHVGSVVVMLSA